MGLIYLLIIHEMMSCSLILLLSMNFLNCLLLNVIITCLTIFLIPRFLNLEKLCIPTSPYSSLDPIVHPSVIVVVSSTSNSIMCPIVSASFEWYYLLSPVVVVSFTSDFVICPTFINVSCAHDYVLSLVVDVCVSFFDCQLIFIFNIVISWFLHLNLERG
jgi:hypothetical protein